MSNYDCHIDIPEVPGLAEKSLSVGREFFLTCQGEWPQDLQKESLTLDLPTKDKYTLKLLHFELRDLKTADLKVVSYLVGKHKLIELKLTDGKQSLALSPVEFEVISVQDPANPKKEPFGPMGPLNLSWPLVYWIILGSVLAIFLSTSFFIFWKRIKRRQWLEEIRQYDNALNPASQFHAELRKLQRKSAFMGANDAIEVEPAEKQAIVQTLSHIVRIFWIREFQIKSLDVSDRFILSEFKKYHRSVYTEQYENLRKWLREINKARLDESRLKFQDLRQLLIESRALVEALIQEQQKKVESI